MAEINLTETFSKGGVPIAVTSAILRDPTGLIGVMRKDTGEVIIVVGTPMVEVSTGVYVYSFDEPIGETGLTYVYWVEWVYESRTYRDVHEITGSVENDLIPTRQMSKYVSWIKKEFEPIGLIVANTDDTVIEQKVENAIRYWNTHSAYKISAVYDYTPGTKRVQISEEFKAVVDVLPTNRAATIFGSYPLWTLTGIAVLDNVTTDLITMTEAFRTYQKYIGTDFRWTFDRADVPTVGGYLYAVNVPHGSQALYVMGTKRITKNEDIKSDYILNWILYYAKALVKQTEGNVLRKTAIIDTPLDGQALYNEGIQEQKDLEKTLSRDSRWVIFMRRK